MTDTQQLIEEAVERINIAQLILNASEQNKILIGKNIAMGAGAELQLKLEKAIKQELTTIASKSAEMERESEELVLNTLYDAVNGHDQRFMEEQGIYLDNRYEHLGFMKAIKFLLDTLSQKESL